VPNGADQNYRRLLMVCAVYRQKYGEWPSQARCHALTLHDLAQLFDRHNFERLAVHLELRTLDTIEITVGGRGVVRYSEVDHGRIDDAVMALAEEWLDLRIRSELEH
jgi:hypothetical protein